MMIKYVNERLSRIVAAITTGQSAVNLANILESNKDKPIDEVLPPEIPRNDVMVSVYSLDNDDSGDIIGVSQFKVNPENDINTEYRNWVNTFIASIGDITSITSPRLRKLIKSNFRVRWVYPSIFDSLDPEMGA